MTALLEPTVPPSIDTAPDVEHSDGGEAIELAADYGLDLDDWQQYSLHRTLGRRQASRGRRWAARECGLVVPRQSGKGSILEARALYGLWVVGEELITWTAHEFKTANEAFMRMRNLIGGESNPDVRKIRYGNDEKSIELRSGQRLIFLARTGGSGRGFTGDCIIFDEAYALTDEQLSALFSTLAARPDPQVWYTSMAGKVDAYVLRRIRDRGIASDERLAYLEWGAGDHADLDDPEAWRRANPAMPHRIDEEFVEDERRTLSDDDFARERLCIWDSRRRQAVIGPDVWYGLGDEGSRPQDPVAFAVDVPPEHDQAAIAVAGFNAAGQLHVELIDYRSGTAWAPQRLAELVAAWQTCGLALDPSAPAGALLEPLRQKLSEHKVDVEPDLVSSRRMAAACGAFYQRAVVDGSLTHLRQPELSAAVDAGRRRKMGDAWVWHRRDTESDISPLVAATLACYELDRHGWQPRPARQSTTVKRLR